MNIRSHLMAIFFFFTNSYSVIGADYCVTIGDSQSAGPANWNYGFTAEVHQILVDEGLDVFTYAMPGSGATHWQDITIKNWHGFYKDKKSIPYQMASFKDDPSKKLSDFSFKRSVENPNYVEQILKRHESLSRAESGSEGKLNCFIIQLGDNDLGRVQGSVQAISKIVLSLKEKHPSLEICGVVTPNFKENHPNDQYKSISTVKKQDYTEALKEEFDKKGLSNWCPVLDSLDRPVLARMKALGEPFTSDGLHFTDKGGRIWAEEALKKHPRINLK